MKKSLIVYLVCLRICNVFNVSHILRFSKFVFLMTYDTFEYNDRRASDSSTKSYCFLEIFRSVSVLAKRTPTSSVYVDWEHIQISWFQVYRFGFVSTLREQIGHSNKITEKERVVFVTNHWCHATSNEIRTISFRSIVHRLTIPRWSILNAHKLKYSFVFNAQLWVGDSIDR